MGIQDEIYKEFFKELKKDKTLSKTMIKELKKLLKSDNTEIYDDLIGLIEEGSENGNKNKNN